MYCYLKVEIKDEHFLGDDMDVLEMVDFTFEVAILKGKITFIRWITIRF